MVYTTTSVHYLIDLQQLVMVYSKIYIIQDFDVFSAKYHAYIQSWTQNINLKFSLFEKNEFCEV